MTTPIPAEAFQHGDPKRYRRGCRCRKCVRAASIQSRNNQYLRNTGRGHLTDIDQAARHIRLLRAAGMPDRDIKTAARIDNDTLYRILRGQGRIHRATERRILNVPIPARPGPGNGADIDGTGTRRRLQALVAAGWPGEAIGRRLGKDRRYVAHILARPNGRVRRWVADQVRALYEELRDLTPEDHGVLPHLARRARLRGDRRGWVTAAYWDPDTIDDPATVPATMDRPRFMALGEDADELVNRQGLSWDQAAARIVAATGRDLTASYLQRSYYRWRGRDAGQDEPGQAVASWPAPATRPTPPPAWSTTGENRPLAAGKIRTISSPSTAAPAGTAPRCKPRRPSAGGARCVMTASSRRCGRSAASSTTRPCTASAAATRRGSGAA